MFFKHIITITNLDLNTTECDITLNTHHLDYPDNVKTSKISTKIEVDGLEDLSEEKLIEWLRENDSQLWTAHQEHEAQLVNEIDNPYEFITSPWKKMDVSELNKINPVISD